MKVLAVVLFLFLAISSVQAEIIAEVRKPGEFAVLFHDTQCEWYPPARFAEYIPEKGEKVEGCWLINGPLVYLKFVDGDVMVVPFDALKDPKKV